MSEFGKHFATTRWTMVLRASNDSDSGAQLALEELCKSYWHPLYAFVRRKGYSPDEAADLTQGFFAHLLAKRVLEKTAPHRGRFRTFLLACIQNFLHNEFDRNKALKRGGGVEQMPLDVAEAESKFALLSAEPSPEATFDRQWASSLLDRTHERLNETANSQRLDLHRALMEFLTLEPSETGYSDLAERFGMTKVAVRVAVHRLREKFRAILRQEVAETIEEEGSVEDEIAYLMEVLKR